MACASEPLTLPHPGLPLRRFALEPLHEIAPGIIHPVEQVTIKEMLARCEDPLQVKKMN